MFQVYALTGRGPSSTSVASPIYVMTSPALKRLPSCGDRIVAVGAVPTRIVMGDDCVVSMPSETATRTVYCPA